MRQTGKFVTDDGRVLVGAPYISRLTGVGTDTVRKHCEAVAVDRGNSRAFLYDLAAALQTLRRNSA